MAYRVLLFDLFGTLVHFKPHVPTVRTAGEERRATYPWLTWLEEQVRRDLPGVSLERLVDAVGAVTEEIVRARPPEFLEVPSRERFLRAVERLGVEGDPAPVAERLSEVHMEHLAARTEIPGGHRDLLDELRRDYALALISNFDHGRTARRILRQHGLDGLFDVTLISADFGRRKPHPTIFHEALTRLGVDPGEALHVGDTLLDDVQGACDAGIDVAWIDRKGAPPGPGAPEPTYVLTRLVELRAVLAAA